MATHVKQSHLFDFAVDTLATFAILWNQKNR